MDAIEENADQPPIGDKMGMDPMDVVEENAAQPPIGDKMDMDPILRQLQHQDKVAMRRTVAIVAAIVVVGAAVIGTVLYFTLGNNGSSSSSASVAFTYGPTIAPSESTDYPTFAPTRKPPTTKPTIKPTILRRPTTSPAGIGFRPSFWVQISQNNTKNSSRVPTSTPVRAPVAIPGPTAPTTPDPTFRPTISPIRRILTNVSLQGGAEFNRPKSYQSKTLAWLEASSRSDTRLRLIQRYALGCIHFATSGVIHRFANSKEVAWKNSTKWLSEADECTWYGVSCNANMQVTGLRLNQNNLTGTFPNETIFLAKTLTVLEIGDNNIWNSFSQVTFLGKLVNLVTLDIGNTYFAFNGIPSVLGNLVKLTALDVSYTLMWGPMRAAQVFGNLRSLTHLEMGGNSYNESIPTEISTLPNLTNFYCDNADIQGDLNFMLDMPSIFEIWLDQNPRLAGTIPSGIGTKTSVLQSISLSECGLVGSIPTELGSLTLLQQLWLNNNQLTGTIPTTLSGMIQFYNFDVSNNQLNGELPTAMCTAITPWNDLCTDCDTVKCCCCTCCTSSTC